MWCPKCNLEFEDEFSVCLKCGTKLQEYVPIVDCEGADDLIEDNREKEPLSEELSLQLLISLPDEEGADDLIERLLSINIPALKKPSEEEGEAFDVFVQESCFQNALNFVSMDLPEDDGYIPSDEELMSEFENMEFFDEGDVDPDEIAKNL